MSHLLAISVGPVQEFIAAARRTRDLWFGSFLLSEISKAVAKSVNENGGNLVFPAPSNSKDLNARSDLSVANIILAEVESGDLKQIAAHARQAARDRWEQFACDAKKQVEKVIRNDIWNDQVGDVIEFYAAWVSVQGDYKQARSRLMRLLAGRKNFRDFIPAVGRVGIPKSSLDGLRESVLTNQKEKSWNQGIHRKLRVRTGEQLDVVAVVKRVGEGSKPYPSVSRIAADPWVRGNHHNQEFSDFKDSVESLNQQNGEVVHRLNTNEYPQFQDFPFEGTAVYPRRHHEWLEESEMSEDEIRDLQAILKTLPEANPYLAVLVADGDRIGAIISELADAESNREFSKTLSGFSAEAKEIASDHNGVLIYAGGDDVLAFLPADKCLDCARKLHDKFGELLGNYKTADGKTPTFSTGIAIGHFLENLEDLLEMGRAAEKHAKTPRPDDEGQEDRDGLAVHLHKRGGAPIEIRSPWDTCPDVRIQNYAELMIAHAIPGGFAYELHQLIDLYASWQAADDAPKSKQLDALRKDTIRVIRDKQPKAGKKYMKEIETLVTGISSIDGFRQFARELLVARQIEVALKQAGYDPPAPQRRNEKMEQAV